MKTLKIQMSNGSGKACNGCAKTKTLRVIELLGSGYLILKSFRFTNGDEGSLRAAYSKANDFMKSHQTP